MGAAVLAAGVAPGVWLATVGVAAAAPDPGGLSAARFGSLVGSDFMLGGSYLRLVEVLPRPPSPADRPGLTGEAFSLVFGGGPTRALSDGTYSLRHRSAGTVSLFLVAIGMARHGQRYQAVVDRRVPSR